MNSDQVRKEVWAATDRLTDIHRQMRRVNDNLKESQLGLFEARERQLAVMDALSRLRSEIDAYEHGQGEPRPSTRSTMGKTNE